MEEIPKQLQNQKLKINLNVVIEESFDHKDLENEDNSSMSDEIDKLSSPEGETPNNIGACKEIELKVLEAKKETKILSEKFNEL